MRFVLLAQCHCPWMECLCAFEKKVLFYVRVWCFINGKPFMVCGSDTLYFSWFSILSITGKKCWNSVILSFLLYIVFEGLFLDVYIHVGLCLLEELTTLLLQNTSFIFDNNHCLDTDFICYKYSQPVFIFIFLLYIFLYQPLTSNFCF